MRFLAVLLIPRNLYNEWVLCTKKADEDGSSASKCNPKRRNALAICPDEWVSFSCYRMATPPCARTEQQLSSGAAASGRVCYVKRCLRLTFRATYRTVIFSLVVAPCSGRVLWHVSFAVSRDEIVQVCTAVSSRFFPWLRVSFSFVFGQQQHRMDYMNHRRLVSDVVVAQMSR